VKFVHSADWQLAARFTQFGAKAEVLREARLRTLQTALQRANELAVDAFLIAGDLFGDSQVDDGAIRATLDTFGMFPHVPIFILPGNHDPNTGPGCLWTRKSFAARPANVIVLLEPSVLECAGCFLIASPLQQKNSSRDPAVKIAELTKGLAQERIRVGITHGALAIPGKYQLNDFPIDLDAATRAGLDYLAVGHWHTWQAYDNGRLLMPGTPEPDEFERSPCGFVALVEISSPGATPQVTQIPVATMQWKSFVFDFVDPDAAKESLGRELNALAPSRATTVVRVTLRGSASPRSLDEVRQWLMPLLDSFQVSQVIDESAAQLTPAEIEEFQRQHPLLAQAVTDLAQVEHLATGTPIPAGINATDAISLADVQRVMINSKIEFASLDAAFFRVAHQLLGQKIREAGQ
jgi:DNA repair exonuclease SbcCD nuclease subunit